MAKKKQVGAEWIGGIVSMPGYVTGEREPYRPEGLFWMSPDGAVVGTSIAKPGEVLGNAAGSLRQAIERPMWGSPQPPSKVRVSSPDLAAALREDFPELEIICAPTPEVEALRDAMREKFNEGYEEHQSYLDPGMNPDLVAGFFHAAAGVFRAKPWKVVPGDDGLISVTIEELGVREAVLSVIGQMGQSFGLVLFTDMKNFEAFIGAADAIERDERPTMPPHLSLNFERGADLAPVLRKEISEHQWDVASPAAYPWLVAVDEDLVARPPTEVELRTFEAIALALPEFMKKKEELIDAFAGGDPLDASIRVQAHAGDVEVILRAPYGTSDLGNEPTYALIAALRELALGEFDRESEELAELQHELLRRFEASPEGKRAGGVWISSFVMDYAASHHRETIATLERGQLHEIVFDLIPRKMSIEASEARGIIEELRAFYEFLRREVNLPQAGACIEVLDTGAVKKLQTALSDPTNFGMAKSLLMGGREAGFDMESKEGIEAWLREIQGKPLPALAPFTMPRDQPGPTGKAAAKAKKDRRKASAKSRKKNR